MVTFGSERSFALRLFAVAAVLGFLAAPVSATPTDSLNHGNFRLAITGVPPVVILQNSFSPVTTIGRSVGSTITAVAFTKGAGPIVTNMTGMMTNAHWISASNFVLPVTDPNAAPIKGVQVTAANLTANFTAAGGATSMGPKFGGVMGLQGANKVCLFGACSAAVANLNVPVGPVGVGGVAVVTAAVNLTVVGAPWTTGTAAIGTIAVVGNQKLPVGVVASSTSMGMSTMGAAGTFHKTNNGMSLVTPIFVSTNIGASAIVPVFGFLNFVVTKTDFMAPEPGTIGMASAIVALIGMGVARRRKS